MVRTLGFSRVKKRNRRKMNPDPESGQGDLRSHSLHVDLHAELRHIENSRPHDSAPRFARLARFSFNWLDPSPKNLKSSCSSRHKSALWGVPGNSAISRSVCSL